jgi:response regulator RpfG family c-di-GMP phosphodiesterase
MTQLPAGMGTLQPPAADESAGRILLVDDEAQVRRGLRRLLSKAGHHVLEASSLAAGRQALDNEAVDVVVLDLGLRDENGLNLLSHAVIVQRSAAAIVFTGSRDRADMKKSLSAGATSYLVKSTDPLAIEAQVESALQRVRTQRAERARHAWLEGSLADALLRWDALPKDIALRLCGAWDLRHIETGTHVRRIGAYSEAIARVLGMPDKDAATLGDVAVLHDIGKLAIPDSILTKPSQLTAQEFDIMKQHAAEGARMLSGIKHPFFERAAVVAMGHHERWDGSGYPGGQRGEDCPFDARIVAIADVYDALGTARCYKPAWDDRQISAYFHAAAGKQFEPRLVEALFASLPRLRELAEQLPESRGISAVFPSARELAFASPSR